MKVQPDEQTIIQTTDVQAECDLETFKKWYRSLNDGAPAL